MLIFTSTETRCRSHWLVIFISDDQLSNTNFYRRNHKLLNGSAILSNSHQCHPACFLRIWIADFFQRPKLYSATITEHFRTVQYDGEFHYVRSNPSGYLTEKQCIDQYTTRRPPSKVKELVHRTGKEGKTHQRHSSSGCPGPDLEETSSYNIRWRKPIE